MHGKSNNTFILLFSGHKGFLPSLQEILEKSVLKSGNRLTVKLLNGGKKAKVKLYQVCFSLTKSICLTLNASHS